MPDNSEPKFAGIEVASSTMRGVVISAAGDVLLRRAADYRPENLIEGIADLVKSMAEAGPIKSVGVGIPGLVNRETDRVLLSTGLPVAARDDIYSELMKATGLWVELANDANAAAYGEYKAGAGSDTRNIFYIGIGQAIGGAIIMDGKLWLRASRCAWGIWPITIHNQGAEDHDRKTRRLGTS